MHTALCFPSPTVNGEFSIGRPLIYGSRLVGMIFYSSNAEVGNSIRCLLGKLVVTKAASTKINASQKKILGVSCITLLIDQLASTKHPVTRTKLPSAR